MKMKLENGCGKWTGNGVTKCGVYNKDEDSKRFCPICTKTIQVKHETLMRIQKSIVPSMNTRNDEGMMRKYIIETQLEIDSELKKLEETGMIKQ